MLMDWLAFLRLDWLREESLSDFSAVRAMHSSVRLRHMLSAFLRSLLSMVVEGAAADDAPGAVMAAKVRASDAVASSAM